MKTRFFTAAATALALTTAFSGAPTLAEDTSTKPTINQKDTQEMTVTQFANDYVELWKTVDADTRASLVDKLFAEDAKHYAAPAGVSFIGRDAILQNVANINMQAIQTAGLKFVGGDAVGNGDSILVEWSAQAPNGATVQSGRDILVLNDEGKVETLYMFTSS